MLRWFRDNFVSLEDTKHYYVTSPLIVAAIAVDENRDLIYDYIYDNVIDYCVAAIEMGDYEKAYERYRSSILSFEETFVKTAIQRRLLRILGDRSSQIRKPDLTNS